MLRAKHSYVCDLEHTLLLLNVLQGTANEKFSAVTNWLHKVPADFNREEKENFITTLRHVAGIAIFAGTETVSWSVLESYPYPLKSNNNLHT
jgi:hypothetical protein